MDPQLATLVMHAPVGDTWLNEIKLDGYRMICRIDRGKVAFYSRNQLSWTDELPHLVEAVKSLPLEQAFLDGEVVAMNRDGTTDFQALQNAFREGQVKKLIYYVFDLLYLDGKDLRPAPLESRKQLLAKLLESYRDDRLIRYSDHVIGNGPRFFQQAAKLRLEGIICKRRFEPYRAGRGPDWVKVKCVQSEEFVIGGYRESDTTPGAIGALLLGYYDSNHNLISAGKVGRGFDRRTHQDLLSRFAKLSSKDSPFSNRRKERSAHWLKPKLVAEVRFSNATKDGRLRHPSFVGLRTDKTPAGIVRDKPAGIASE